ncbi:oxidoreductase [Winogradskya humida]|uniref:Oxidoreductase n=2 Tax=Winogradskya humida TaxID=113566 RepID=A0ABQ3ZHA2_9ACTN|nr:oxidoreductase [Actinoplanes humidus]
MTITAEAAGTAPLGDRVVNRMGFGTMRITANPDRDLAIRVLRRAYELGVNHFDTAAFYVSPGGTLGVGTGEKRYAAELLRAALSPYPSEIVIATKVGTRSGKPLRERIEANLQLLGVERLDVVNLRLADNAGSLAEPFAELARMRDEGLIRDLGISNVTVAHLDEAQTIAPVVCVQNAFGLDYPDRTMLDACGQRQIAFVPFFSLAGTDREKGTPATVRDHQQRLAWTLHQGPHVLAIPGTGSVEHLEQNIAAGALAL